MVKRSTLIASIIVLVLLVLVVGLQALVAAAHAAAHPSDSSTVVPLDAILDTTLYEENGSFSNGKGEYIFAGATQLGNLRRGLVKFDIANNVPSNTLIVSATLKLRVSLRPFDNPQSQLFAIHRVTSDWGEGTSDAGDPGGGGTFADEGDATWTFSFYSPTPTERISWTNMGGDFTPAASATTLVGEQDKFYSWGPSSAMLADIQHWLRYPDDNHGWIIVGNESEDQTARRFDSRQNGEPAYRPTLTVEYVAAEDMVHLPLIIGQ